MKLIGWVFGIPLAALMVVLAVGNRHDVLLSAFPAPFELELPLALVIFCALVLGVFWGGVAGWFSQSRLRATARDAVFKKDIMKRDLEVAERTIKDLKNQLAEARKSDAGEKTNLPSLPRDAA